MPAASPKPRRAAPYASKPATRYSTRAITSTMSVSPVARASSRASLNRSMRPVTRSTKPLAQSPKGELKSQLKVVENTAHSSALNAQFAVFLGLIIVGTFVLTLLLNIQISALAIESENVKVQIDKTKQDTQSIRTQMEQKGSAIAARAGALGMVQRDKTITIRLGLNHVVTHDETLPPGTTPQE